MRHLAKFFLVVVTALVGSVASLPVFATICTYSLSPLDLSNTPANGGYFDVAVTTPSGCPVAVTSYQPWVSVSNIAPSGGTTTVSLQIGTNFGALRATSIVIADRLFLITQPALTVGGIFVDTLAG